MIVPIAYAWNHSSSMHMQLPIDGTEIMKYLSHRPLPYFVYASSVGSSNTECLCSFARTLAASLHDHICWLKLRIPPRESLGNLMDALSFYQTKLGYDVIMIHLYMCLVVRKPVFGGMWTTKEQTSLRENSPVGWFRIGLITTFVVPFMVSIISKLATSQ